MSKQYPLTMIRVEAQSSLDAATDENTEALGILTKLSRVGLRAPGLRCIVARYKRHYHDALWEIEIEMKIDDYTHVRRFLGPEFASAGGPEALVRADLVNGALQIYRAMISSEVVS